MSTQRQLNKAYREGCRARNRQDGFNPYGELDQRHDSWERGWWSRAAEIELEDAIRFEDRYDNNKPN